MLFAGCEKIFMPRDTEATPTATFDYLWQQIDERYSLFDVKDVDWNAVRDSLRPRVYDEMSNDSLFAILKKMINTLDDGHVDIWGNYDIASSEQIYLQRYANSNFDLNTVALNYLRADHHTTGGLVYNSIAGGQVLYIRYSSFSNSASTALMQTVINRYPEYPLFEGERYVGLAYKYMLIDQDYELITLNEPLVIVEYQADGSSFNMFKQYWRNPRGFAFFRKAEMKTTKSLKRKLQVCTHYVSSSIISRNWHFIQESPEKLLTALCIPGGIALYLLIRHKVKHDAKMNIGH